MKRVQVGRQLFERGDFEPALIQFQKAHALTRSWKLLIYIGVAQNRAKQYCAALATLQRYLEQGGAAVPDRERASVEAELETIHALRAHVEVVVQGPPGATITVGRERRGKAPLSRPLCLEVGRRTVKASLPGHVDARETLDVEPQGRHRVVLTLKRARGELRIESSPPGARIWLDDRELGIAPQERALLPGEYRVKAELEGYLPRAEKVQLEAKGRVFRLDLVARPPPPPPPWYTRWYWWTAIGAAVTAGVVGGVVYALRPDYDVPIDGDP